MVTIKIPVVDDVQNQCSKCKNTKNIFCFGVNPLNENKKDYICEKCGKTFSLTITKEQGKCN